MDYLLLKTTIEGYAHRDDLSAYMDRFTSFATSRIGRDLRITEMEEQEAITIDSASISLPSDFAQGRGVTVAAGGGTYALKYRTPPQLATEYGGAILGLPRAFSITGNKLITGPAPDSTYSGTLYYYAKPSALVNNADTNTVLTDYPQIYLYASLYEVAIWAENDNLAQKFGGLYKGEVDMLNESSRDSQYIGPLEMRTG